MVEYDPKTKAWYHEANPAEDFIPMGSYLGESILKRFNASDPDQVAEINGDTGEISTMKNIHCGTITAAKNLQRLGANCDDRILIFCRINSHISSVICACYILGIPFCPIDVMDYDLDYLFGYIKPTILICDGEFQEEVDMVECKSLKQKLVFGVNAEAVLFRPQEFDNFIEPKFTRSADELVACLLLTSGSTGRPKVVKLSHSIFINSTNALRYSKLNAPCDVLLGTAGLRWISHICRMMCAIFYSSPQMFTGKDPDPENICKLIDRLKPTNIFAPNSFLQEIFYHYKESNKYDFSSLKLVLNGGETPIEAINNKWRKEFPGITTINGYGITEVGGPVAINTCKIKKPVNGGEIYPGYQVKIVGEDGHNLGPDQCGVVHIKLRVPFLKYHKRPEDDDKSFTPDGWFITGDYGKMTEENYLHIYCRFKDIPRCKGMLLIPNLVEEHINQHPLVNLGVIVGMEDKILIFIKLVDGDDTQMVRSELDVYLRGSVDWKLVEKVVYLKKFKIISTGKVDKGELKRGYLEGEY